MSNQLKNTIMKTKKQKKFIEEMFNLLNADEVIPHLVTEIDEEIQLKIFDLPDEEAAEIMREYVKHDYWLCDEAQLKVFGLPNVAEILLEYVKHGWALCKEAQFKVFDLPDEKAVEIILECVKHGRALYYYNGCQLKVFGLPNAAEILLEYVKHHRLYWETQLKIFDLPDEKAAKIMLEYTKHGGGLCPEARKRYDELMAKSAKG